MSAAAGETARVGGVRPRRNTSRPSERLAAMISSSHRRPLWRDQPAGLEVQAGNNDEPRVPLSRTNDLSVRRCPLSSSPSSLAPRSRARDRPDEGRRSWRSNQLPQILPRLRTAGRSTEGRTAENKTAKQLVISLLCTHTHHTHIRIIPSCRDCIAGRSHKGPAGQGSRAEQYMAGYLEGPPWAAGSGSIILLHSPIHSRGSLLFLSR